MQMFRIVSNLDRLFRFSFSFSFFFFFFLDGTDNELELSCNDTDPRIVWSTGGNADEVTVNGRVKWRFDGRENRTVEDRGVGSGRSIGNFITNSSDSQEGYFRRDSTRQANNPTIERISPDFTPLGNDTFYNSVDGFTTLWESITLLDFRQQSPLPRDQIVFTVEKCFEQHSAISYGEGSFLVKVENIEERYEMVQTHVYSHWRTESNNFQRIWKCKWYNIIHEDCVQLFSSNETIVTRVC